MIRRRTWSISGIAQYVASMSYELRFMLTRKGFARAMLSMTKLRAPFNGEV